MPNDTDASAQIDAILATLPAGQRTALQSLRRTIATAASDAVEGLSELSCTFRSSVASLRLQRYLEDAR